MRNNINLLLASSLASSLGLYFAPTAYAEDNPVSIDWTIYGDMRAYSASGERSWFHKGLGKTRYGTKADGDRALGLELAEISLIADMKIGWDWQVFVHGGYTPEQSSELDVIEAFVEYKPAPKGRLGLSGRAGLMFPHMSRENVGVAWTSPYSITPSAINSWIGEEVRTLGLELTAKYRLDNSDISMTASAFGFNDTTGTLLHFRGWALHDLKVGAVSTLPLPTIPSLNGWGDINSPEYRSIVFWNQGSVTEPIYELDDKVGYYFSVDWSNRRGVKLGAQYYTNRGEPTAFEKGQYGWKTRFYNLYGEIETDSDWTLIGQYMTGKTDMGPWLGDFYPASSGFQSAFVLASKKLDDWRITARFDWFDTNDYSLVERDNNNEDGISALLASSYQINDNFTVVGEWLYVMSDREVRTHIDLPLRTHSNQFQLSLRFRF